MTPHLETACTQRKCNLSLHHGYYCRRVAALREIQDSYDTINKDYHKELAALQAKYEEKYAPLYDQRKEVIAGNTKVQTYDIPDDGEGG